MSDSPKPKSQKQQKLSLENLIDGPTVVLSDDDRSVSAASKSPSYREGKRAFTAWAKKDAYKALKNMATDKDTTVQALLEEGMDLVFEKYGYAQIARKP